jgi:3-phenylpropionate/cinnamic acid dioxygenase small subunit
MIAAPDIVALLAIEAMLLDRRRFEEWLDLFTPDCHYWMPVDPDAPDTEDVLCHVNDDRARMHDRLNRLAGAHTEEPPPRTSRVLGHPLVIGGNGVDCLTRTPFQMVVARHRVHEVFAGSYRHECVAIETRWRIRSKRVDLIEADTALPPLTVLF